LTVISEKLKAAREAKGYSIEHVSRETNIARRYIEALEDGDFSQFPAEAYLIGFLKNYGEYLALDGNELQAQYRMHKIQEQPIPVEQLLKEPSRMPRIAIGVVSTVFAAMLIFAVVFYIVGRAGSEGGDEVRAARANAVYQLDEGILEQRLYAGDAVQIARAGGSAWELVLQKIGDIVTLGSPDGELLLNLNDTVTADINSDGLPDVQIIASDFLPNKPETGVLLRIEMPKTAAAATAGGAGAGMPEEAPPVPAASELGNQATNSQAIFTGNTPYPFTLQVRFQAYCMMRWEILREANQGRNERYFVKGDELNIQAQNGVRLWISNAAAVKTQVIGGGRTVAIEFGGSGEVIVADVTWMRDTDGRYKLIQTRLEN
jgi:cytoskeletal protein RodZ